MRIRIVTLCLAVALVVSATAAASASAFKEEAPEVGRCLKLTGGRFKEAGCKTAAKVSSEQKYEWYPAFGPNGKGEEKIIAKPELGYTAKSKEGTVIRLETVHGEIISCKTQTSEGEITGPKADRNFDIVFTGCEVVGDPCTSTNPKATNEGEINVKELSGTIGVEKTGATSSADKLANVFIPASGEVFTEFECSGLKIVVKGEVMVPIKDNAMLSVQTVKFTATKGKQKPEKFATDAAGTKRVLYAMNSNLKEFFQAGQTLTTTQTSKTGEKLEASSVN